MQHSWILYEDIPQIRINCLIIQLLIELFTIDIYSTTEGIQAWFEIILVTGGLFACGYLVWWEFTFIIIAVLLGTLAAGMFACLAPQYVQSGNFTASKPAVVSLKSLSKHKNQSIYSLTGKDLAEFLDSLDKARTILKNSPRLLNEVSEFKEITENVEQGCSQANTKIRVEYQAQVVQQEQEAERERQRQEAEKERQRQEAEKERQRQEAEKERQRRAELEQRRRKAGFIGGHYPDEQYDPPRCLPDYLIKVTLNKPDGYYDGIIWKPIDREYTSISPVWCFRTVEEAQAESQYKYKFRRPKNNKGKLRP